MTGHAKYIHPGLSREQYLRKLANAHNKKHICPVCGDSFFNDVIYKEHYKDKHSKRKGGY